MGAGVILTDFWKALAQLTDPRFRRVVLLGLGLSIGLLIGAYYLLLLAISALVPASFDLPFVGKIDGIRAVLEYGSVLVTLILSVFLMVPVASAFSGIFVEDVAQAVEDRHHPHLPQVKRMALYDSVIATINFLGIFTLLNVLALIFYPFLGPFAPLLFWGLNGYLLGREYFGMVAARRLPRAEAKALRRRHGAEIWVAGILMAAPLSIPLVNLLVPVLGVATFTHLFHRLNQTERQPFHLG